MQITVLNGCADDNNEHVSLVIGVSTFCTKCCILGLMAIRGISHSLENTFFHLSCAEAVHFIIGETRNDANFRVRFLDHQFIIHFRMSLLLTFFNFLLWKFALVYESAFNYLAMPLAASLAYDEEKSFADMIKVRIDGHESCFRSPCTYASESIHHTKATAKGRNAAQIYSNDVFVSHGKL